MCDSGNRTERELAEMTGPYFLQIVVILKLVIETATQISGPILVPTVYVLPTPPSQVPQIPGPTLAPSRVLPTPPSEVPQIPGPIFVPIHVLPTPPPEETTFCSGRGYKNSSHVCCANTIRERQNGQLMTCCGTAAYLRGPQICCHPELLVVDVPNPTFVSCCKTTPYSFISHLCCDGKLLGRPDSSHSCCGNVVFNQVTDLCCKSNFSPRAKAEGNSCCGNGIYKPASQLCCANKAVAKPLFHPQDLQCCGAEIVNLKIQICCNGTVHSQLGCFTECCDTKAYNPENQICCQNKLYVKPFSSGDRFTCCGGDMIDQRMTHRCRGRQTSMRTGAIRACCGSKGFDRNIELCCAQTVVRQRNGFQLSRCCGPFQYNRNTHICCFGSARKDANVLTRKYGIWTSCCGALDFDRRTHFCTSDKSLKTLASWRLDPPGCGPNVTSCL